MGNSWSKPTPQGGGFISHHPSHGTLVSGNTVSNGNRIDPGNHTHFHKDGVTVTHNGHKSTVSSSGYNNGD